MLTNKQFRLERAALAIGNAEGRRKAITIPLGSVIKLVAEPHKVDGMVNVVWQDRALEMFAVDVDARGTED